MANPGRGAVLPIICYTDDARAIYSCRLVLRAHRLEVRGFPQHLRITKRQRAGDSESDMRSFFTRKKVHVGSEGGREILAVVASFSVSS